MVCTGSTTKMANSKCASSHLLDIETFSNYHEDTNMLNHSSFRQFSCQTPISLFVSMAEASTSTLLQSHFVGLCRHQLKRMDRLSSKYNFDKPNDGRALGLMNAAAVAVLEELPEVRLAYGISDEYRSSIQIPAITTDN